MRAAHAAAVSFMEVIAIPAPSGDVQTCLGRAPPLNVLSSIKTSLPDRISGRDVSSSMSICSIRQERERAEGP
ncbi:hypothetical protein EVAR_718_1 [Eumeta japonica]|uniref:Uncharacterized protein n=1 Tax=Eumeta variegata TaxID=151549 RepID=A0A4C1SDX7_EUMVA|nr:hypothetical protein EVAR_718_1 [Eumeta japonica]